MNLIVEVSLLCEFEEFELEALKLEIILTIIHDGFGNGEFLINIIFLLLNQI